jgi:hypothetical protein
MSVRDLIDKPTPVSDDALDLIGTLVAGDGAGKGRKSK